jgi:hypothetical protein
VEAKLAGINLREKILTDHENQPQRPPKREHTQPYHHQTMLQ